jgi:hypothetical protein
MSISLGVVGDFVNASADDARLPGMVAQAQALLVSEFNEQAVGSVLWDWATVQTVGELWEAGNLQRRAGPVRTRRSTVVPQL